jgi:hypothetical protein
MLASKDAEHRFPRLRHPHFVRTKLVERMIQGVIRSVLVAAMGHRPDIRTQVCGIVEWAFKLSRRIVTSRGLPEPRNREKINAVFLIGTMKTILLGLWIGCIGGMLVPSSRGAELNAQQRAVMSFPDVGRAGSSLNLRFLELHRRAVAEKSDVLADPDWPSILTRKAAAQLADEPAARAPSPTPVPMAMRKQKPTAILPNLPAIGSAPSSELVPDPPAPPGLEGTKEFPRIRLQSLKLHVPSSDPPDFTTKGPIGEISRDWQKKMAHRLTLPGQIFTEGVTLPEEIPSTLGPGFWRRAAQYFRAVQRRNEAGVRAMMTAEAQEALEMESVSIGHRRLKECTVQMIIEVENAMVVFWRDRTMEQPPFALVQRDGDYVVSTVRAHSEDHQRLFRDMFWFLMVNPPKAMISKER